MSIRLAPHAPVLVLLALVVIAVRMAWPMAQRWARTRAATRELAMRRRAWEPTRG